MAQESLIAFTRYTKPDYRPAGHHKLIADALERVERGECKRLMIFMPPRHGKSELASRRFPAWFLGRNPDRSIIAASYNSELATDFGREVRDIVATKLYGNVFDARLSDNSQAAGRWHTNGRGGYVAAGVGTAVTGRGAHVLLIDDPFKDRQDADSDIIRERVWRWYTSTAYTRLEGDITATVLEDDDIWADFLQEIEEGEAEPFEGAVVLIQTRWNEDDLGGRLLRAQAEGGDQWEVLDLPAIDEAGQALWPEKFSVERLHRIKAAIGPRDWSALYQQRPTPDEGTYFQKTWFHRHAYADPKKAKATRHVYITSDFAVTEDGGDYTEHAVWGYGNNGTLAQLDWWHGQKDASVWIEKLIDLIEKWAPLCYFGEQGVIEKAVRPMLVRRMRERKASCRIEWVPSVRDKATRARPFQARASMGKVSLLNDERGERVLGQLLTFPAGRHDDAVDVCSLIGLVIDQAHPAVIAPPKVEKNRDNWNGKSDDYDTEDADWKAA
jgi:predicted phage terminase large subunit-like protein